MSVNEYLALWENKGHGTYQNEFREIWDRGLNTWLPLIVKTPEKCQPGEREDEHQGLPHLNNIYHIVTQLVSISKYQFSDLEYFLIATSILFHDIGRAPYDIAPEECEPCPYEGRKEICPCKFFTNHRRRNKYEFHAYRSALMVSKFWVELGFHDRLLADCCAYCCGLHTLDRTPQTGEAATQGRQIASKLQDFCYLLPHVKQRQFSDFRYGATIHPLAIAALLRVGDELDNSYLRKIPGFFRGSEIGEDLRSRVREVELDTVGKCIKIHVDADVPAQKDAGSWQRALNSINTVLRGWASPLSEHGLGFKKGFYLQPDGRLIGVERIQKPGKKSSFKWEGPEREPALTESKTLERIYQAASSL